MWHPLGSQMVRPPRVTRRLRPDHDLTLQLDPKLFFHHRFDVADQPVHVFGLRVLLVGDDGVRVDLGDDRRADAVAL